MKPKELLIPLVSLKLYYYMEKTEFLHILCSFV